MRIVLIYPPPWKISAPEEDPYPPGQGPYRGWKPGTPFSGSELRTPYGLFSLAAQALKAGHQVTLYNLYSFSWKDIREIIRSRPADLYGLSCFTQNRRGTRFLAEEIKRIRPEAFVVAGGPHAGALPVEILEHYPAIDAVLVGEAEHSFMELIARLERHETLEGLNGMVFRQKGVVQSNAVRNPIDDLDSLISPYEYFSGDVIISSRGCPGDCTFCSSPVLWGRKVRFHTADYILRNLENLVRRDGKRMIAFKDDTFTFNRGRVFEICAGIQKNNLNFIWSCDTRADALDEEVLQAMRHAGCQLLSLGVESGSPDILKSINKRTSPEEILKVTEMAKKFGFQIRYYMMAANRRETTDTLKASFDFLMKAKPNQFIYYFLMLYPGTREFGLAEEQGLIDREMFFSKDWPYFAYPLPKKTSPEMQKMIHWIYEHPGTRDLWAYGIPEREAILARLLHVPAVHLEAGVACYQAGLFTQSEKYFYKALELNYPLSGIALNYLACLAAGRSDYNGAMECLQKASKDLPLAYIQKNIALLHEWMTTGERLSPTPALITKYDFEFESPLEQPLLPGPIAF